MKFKFKFSSELVFRVNVEYPYVDENEVLSRIENCIDRFESTFDDYTLLDVVGNYISDETWAEVSKLNCNVIKNDSKCKAGEITFDCEVEFDGNACVYDLAEEIEYEDGFYEEFMWALSENGCYVDTYAIYTDGDEVEDFDLNVSCDEYSIKYSCEIVED